MTDRRNKKEKDAIDYADKMIEMKPELDKGYYLKGLGLWYLHDYISALKALSKAIDIAPNKKQYHFIRGYINYDLRNCQMLWMKFLRFVSAICKIPSTKVLSSLTN